MFRFAKSGSNGPAFTELESPLQFTVSHSVVSSSSHFPATPSHSQLVAFNQPDLPNQLEEFIVPYDSRRRREIDKDFR